MTTREGEEAPKRRSRKQIAADERAVVVIAGLVKGANRFQLDSLRETLDRIGDTLVEAGRL